MIRTGNMAFFQTDGQDISGKSRICDTAFYAVSGDSFRTEFGLRDLLFCKPCLDAENLSHIGGSFCFFTIILRIRSINEILLFL